jgi:hypothetical protein
MIDIYGQKISLTYKGEETYKTSPGAITTLILVVIICIYAGMKGNILLNKLSPTVTKQSFVNDLNIAGVLNPFEYNFDFAFGLPVTLDPTIGYYSVKFINYYYENYTDSSGSPVRTKNKTVVPFSNCNTSNFVFSNWTQADQMGISKF